MINMHRNLERYLDLPESERMTGGAIGRPGDGAPVVQFAASATSGSAGQQSGPMGRR